MFDAVRCLARILEIPERTARVEFVAVGDPFLVVRIVARSQVVAGLAESGLLQFIDNGIVTPGKIRKATGVIGFPEPVRSGLREIAEPLLVFLERLFGPFAGRDVVDGGQEGRLAFPGDLLDAVFRPPFGAVLSHGMYLVAGGGFPALVSARWEPQNPLVLAFAKSRKNRVERQDRRGGFIAAHVGERLVDKEELVVPTNREPLIPCLQNLAEMRLALFERRHGLNLHPVSSLDVCRGPQGRSRDIR